MRTPVVAVWNELTPYRLHVMRRVERELPGIRVTNVFTHSVSDNSMPWKMNVDGDLDVRFDAALRIPRPEQYLHRHALGLARSVLRVVDEVKPVMVMMHGHNDLVRLMLIRRIRSRGVPIAHLSDANMFDERYSVRPRHAFRRLYLRWILSMMDGYLPMGTGGRAFYRYFGRHDRPSFAFPYEPDYGEIQAVSHEATEAFRVSHGLAPNRRRFLYSGRLVPTKRVDLLLQSYMAIRSEVPDWDLVIAGDGPLRQSLEAMVPADAKQRVRFLGFLQMDGLRHAYRLCDALVHPSEREPWALVINEAVAAGMAVIATNITGAAVDLVRHRVNGWLVTPGSPDELREALRQVAAPGAVDGLRAASGRVLADWKAAADPVRGFEAAVGHFSRCARSQG